MNPLRSHWFRVSMALLVASPLVALLAALSAGVGFRIAFAVTLYMWLLVCGILALIALATLTVRLLGRGMRVLRR